MKTVLSLAIVILGSLANATAIADSTPPTTPQLSYSIYSGRSAELFWSNAIDDSVNLTYQLERDGEVVYSGDGLSFYDKPLVAGQLYTYSLTVEGADGLVSDAVNVEFDTNDRLNLTPEPPVSTELMVPVGLRADVYSARSLELFWGRMPNAALSYDVTLDGVNVGSTDGTSLYVNSGIEREGVYTFEVTAVRSGAAGVEYSAPAVITVDIAESLAPTPPPVIETPPSPPQNVSLVRNSLTQVTLSWDVPADEEGVVATDIFRNGSLIATVSGSGFVDTTLSSGIAYTYELVAIDNVGERSTPTLFSPALALSDPDYFKEVALNSEFGNSVSRIRKWQSDINYIVLGDASAELLTELDRVVSEINFLIDDVQLVEVEDQSEANFTVFFGSGDDYAADIEPSAVDLVSFNFGLVWSYWNANYELFAGSMYVDTLRAESIDHQKHLLREELTQALGLFTDSFEYPESIFYGGYSLTTEYTRIDRELIETLYRPEVEVGMNMEALDLILGLD